MSPSPFLQTDARTSNVARDLLGRIGVRPPYFALSDLELEGLYLHATARAESPPYLECGPMPAAELGRHAAIAGSCHAASTQPDDARRYYLARRASCRYVASDQPYGAPVRFRSEIVESSKRACRAAVTATVRGAPLATFEIDYTILTEAAFRRLFRHRAAPTPDVGNPYGALLAAGMKEEDGGEAVAQHVDELPASACAGHFEAYPALPVAVVMGQLSYLAGRLFGRPPEPFRVVRGEVSAADLAWAGETVQFRARREGMDAESTDAPTLRLACEAMAGDRRVGEMSLWLASVE